MDTILKTYDFPFDWGFDDYVAIERNQSNTSDAGITEEQLNTAIKDALANVKLTGDGLIYTLMVDNEEAGKIIIPKDQFLKGVEYQEEDKNLVFTFVTEDDDNKVVSIPLGEIFDVDNLATKEELEAVESKLANYQPKGDYLTEHQSLEGLAKTSEVDEKIKDLDKIYQEKGDYAKMVEFDGNRKSLVLNKRDTISSEGINIAMVSDYEGLDFSVVEVGSQKAALVLNTCEDVVKVEVVEQGKRVQHEVATDVIVEALEKKLTDKFEAMLKNYNIKSNEELVSMIKAGGDVVLVSDVKAPTDVTITKDANIDLAGNTLSAVGGTYGDTAVFGNGCDVTISDGEIIGSEKASVENSSATILVKTAYATKLTLNNIKSTGIHPLYVNSSNEGTLVTINGGEFYTTMDTSDADADHRAPAVYVACGSSYTTGGKVIINDGVFGQPDVANNFLLNVLDKLRQQEGKKPIDFIEVRGGVFYNFDPSDNKAEGQGTNFVAPGYKVVKEVISETTTKYTVLPND